METLKNAYFKIKDLEKEITIKEKKDYVTNCDLLVEEYIINEMKTKYPDIEILSEELNFDKEKTNKYFVIDPIDGTINFASGLDLWGMQVAYIENDTILASCIYLPKLDMLFTATTGGGSYLNGNEIQVKPYKDLESSLIVLDYSRGTINNFALGQLISDKVLRVRDIGAGSFSFAMVARGSIDGFCCLGKTPWDIDPGLLVCMEAGAKVHRDDFCTIVANSDEIIEMILELIKVVFKDN